MVGKRIVNLKKSWFFLSITQRISLPTFPLRKVLVNGGRLHSVGCLTLSPRVACPFLNGKALLFTLITFFRVFRHAPQIQPLINVINPDFPNLRFNRIRVILT